MALNMENVVWMQVPEQQFDSDVEEEANGYFQKIYSDQKPLDEVVAMLKKFKSSTVAREQQVFACMIHNLFDEYRFFPRYPEKVTGAGTAFCVAHVYAVNPMLHIRPKAMKGFTTHAGGKHLAEGVSLDDEGNGRQMWIIQDTLFLACLRWPNMAPV